MSSSALAAGLRDLRARLAEQQHNHDSDEQLLHAFTNSREDSAFAVLVRRHGPMVLHVCRRVLRHEQDAEDAFQATFLVLAQNADSLRNKASLVSFLHGTAYRTAMKAKQTAARRRKHESRTPVRPVADPSDELSWREVRLRLDEEIANLPEIYRSAFVLCYLENLNRAEAAQRLGLKERTVLSRLAEARKRLSQRLARRGVELTAVLAAAALTTPASALPARLLLKTIKAVLSIASGKELASVVSASVAEMVQSATAAVIGGKSKIALVLLLIVTTSGSLVGWYARASGPLAATEEPPAAKADKKPPVALEFAAPAGNTIEGTVKDAASGKPIPGCRIRNTLSGESPENVDFDVVSGDRGEYRLEGVPKHDTVVVVPPKDSLYLKRQIEVAHTARQPKIKLDIELAKGAIVTGRVVDKQTGKGVQGNVVFSPLAGNRFYGTKPGFDQRFCGSEETDKDGRFRSVTIPGKSLVVFQIAHPTEKLNGRELHPYRGAVPDPDHKDIFIPDSLHGSWNVGTADGQFLTNISGYYAAVKVIDAKENGETRVELFVDRGVTARIVVQDADGKPLAGVWAAGVTEYPQWLTTYKLPEATTTVYALNPDKPREMVFFHAEKKLGGTAIVRGDEKEPVVVKLAPLGQVSGRLLGEDGKPLEGVEVSLGADLLAKSAGELDRVVAPRGKPVRTDKDGRFHIESVVPGLKFTLFVQAKAPIFGGGASLATRQVQVKPSESLNVGDMRDLKPWRP